MNADHFIDTNVIVYAASARGEESWKRTKALAILEPAEFATSGQVLQEFYVTVTRKMKSVMPAQDALAWIERLGERPVVPVDLDLVMRATSLSQRFNISYWDAAILAAAECVNAPVLYTEDLNDGQIYGSVKAVNPFKVN
jgi:predicted nucleic acid-binding protein